jgi:hypothetical protein
MIDGLRRFLSRPVTDADRPRLFALAAAAIVCAAGLFALLDDAGSAPVHRIAEPAPAAVPREPEAPEEVTTDAKRVARRFLPGYLAFIYGHGGAGSIEAAAPELRLERPRVPRRVARLRPRIVLLQAEGPHVMALVRDGRRRYTVTLEVADGRVVDVGG